MNRKEIKAKAKEFAFKNKWNIWKPYLVIMAISFIFGVIVAACGVESDSSLYELLSTALQIALLPASIGYTYYIMQLLKGNNMDVQEALTCKYKMFGLIFTVTILVGIFTTLWTLLLIVPGIIYAFKMSMVGYILAEEEVTTSMTAKEVMNKSKDMMDGYKMDYFVFGLSFFGWILLCLVTLGIAMIQVMPYITVAEVMYYQELKDLKYPAKKATKKEA